jgi:ribosomal protein RSM22 (predicted rRNA methylase)
MKKTLTMLTVAGAMAALAAPAGAAKPDKAKVPSAEKQCRTERTAMGHATFAQTYGTGSAHKNAFGKCVSERNAATRAARKAAKGDTAEVAKTVKAEVKADINAAKACKAERGEDSQAFSEKYGTNAGNRNAFGKCVSAMARESHGSDS